MNGHDDGDDDDDDCDQFVCRIYYFTLLLIQITRIKMAQ